MSLNWNQFAEGIRNIFMKNWKDYFGVSQNNKQNSQLAKPIIGCPLQVTMNFYLNFLVKVVWPSMVLLHQASPYSAFSLNFQTNLLNPENNWEYKIQKLPTFIDQINL